MSLSKITGIFGDVEFSVNEGETYSKSNEITERPVESGVNIVDNVNTNPDIIAFSGVIVGPDAFPKLQLLRRYLDEAVIVRYIGRNDISSVVIQNLDTVHDNTIRNGFIFSCTVKRVKIAVGVTFDFDTSKIVRQKAQVKTAQGKKNKEEKRVIDVVFDDIQEKINSRLGGSKLPDIPFIN